MYNYNYSDELYHYGVKGMKWGVRKAMSQYLTTRQNARKSYRDDLSVMRSNNDKKGMKQRERQYRNEIKTAKSKYQKKTSLTQRQKNIRTGATVAAALITAPFGGSLISGFAVNRLTTVGMRYYNDDKLQQE